MGGKRSWTGLYLNVCIAGLIFAALAACAPLPAAPVNGRQAGRVQLQQARDLARQGNFEGAVREDRKLLALSPGKPPADAALFNLGLIFADRNNPGKDYGKALNFFTRITEDFPGSPLAEEAGIWVGVLDETTALQRDGYAHLQRMQQLTREGDFNKAVQENMRILFRSAQSPPADAALFSLGLIFADPAYPRENSAKAQILLTRLLKDFPCSPFAKQARILDNLLRRKIMDQKKDWRLALPQVERLVKRGNFKGALREDRKVLKRFPKSPPGDAALFSMGLIHIYFANPQKNYIAALNVFTRLKNDFPHSPFVGAAQTWICILKRMEAAAMVDIKISKEKKDLQKTGAFNVKRKNSGGRR